MKTATEIMLEVCLEYGIKPDDLRDRHGKRGRISDARHAFVNRLNVFGHFSIREIAKFTGMNAASVKYHLYPKAREKNVRNLLNRNLRLAQQEYEQMMEARA